MFFRNQKPEEGFLKLMSQNMISKLADMLAEGTLVLVLVFCICIHSFIIMIININICVLNIISIGVNIINVNS